MLAFWVVIINLSSAPLHNAMVVFGENATEIGNIQVGDTIQVEMPRISNYRVIFTLGQGRED